MVKRTFLHAVHTEHQAEFCESAGWDIPGHFGDPDAEYRAVRQGAGILDLGYHATLFVRGSDRVQFLQGMVSNDVKNLPSGSGCHAALLNLQGKVRTDLWIYPQEEALRIDVHPAGREVLITTLEKHIISEDVRIEDATDRFGLLSLQGPEAPTILMKVFPGAFPEKEFQETVRESAGAPVRLIRRSGYTGEIGFEILAPTEIVADLWRRFLEGGARPVGAEAFDILRVEAGVPLVGRDMDETTLALEAPLESAIHLDKGCYIGQEVVARISFRGHVNRNFVGFRMGEGSVPEVGSRVMAGEKDVGRVTSSAFSPFLGCPIALGYIRRETSEPGTQVTVVGPAGPQKAEIANLPFFRKKSADP